MNRWERSTGTIHAYTANELSIATSAPTAFREDRNGNVWIGFTGAGSRVCATAVGIQMSPRESSNAYKDYDGTLWLGTNVGLVRLKNNIRIVLLTERDVFEMKPARRFAHAMQSVRSTGPDCSFVIFEDAAYNFRTRTPG